MQNAQLDAYINTLGSRLKALNPLQREEEMREVRQHLEALTLWHLQQGKNQDEAVELAIKQFGRAEQIGSAINKVPAQKRIWQNAGVISQLFCAWLFIATIQFLATYWMNGNTADSHDLWDRLTISGWMSAIMCCGFFFKVLKSIFFSAKRLQ